MRELVFSPKMSEKLDDIYAYISNELHSPIAAANTITKIMDGLEILKQYPNSGPKLASIYNKTPAYFAQTRYRVCGNYVVVYDHDDEKVYLLQVYHGSENYSRHLFQPYGQDKEDLAVAERLAATKSDYLDGDTGNSLPEFKNRMENAIKSGAKKPK